MPSWPGLSPQVEFTRLAAVKSAEIGRARVPVPSTSLVPQDKVRRGCPARGRAGRASSSNQSQAETVARRSPLRLLLGEGSLEIIPQLDLGAVLVHDHALLDHR